MCESNNIVGNNNTFSIGPLSMKSPFITLKWLFTLVTIIMYKLNQDWQMFYTHHGSQNH
jgi:hypothetical protein